RGEMEKLQAQKAPVRTHTRPRGPSRVRKYIRSGKKFRGRAEGVSEEGDKCSPPIARPTACQGVGNSRVRFRPLHRSHAQ
ncbi:hypothetical protein PFISCL1PPCAC_12814, partial [Pristionchus fissidentatus]